MSDTKRFVHKYSDRPEAVVVEAREPGGEWHEIETLAVGKYPWGVWQVEFPEQVEGTELRVAVKIEGNPKLSDPSNIQSVPEPGAGSLLAGALLIAAIVRCRGKK